MENMTMPVTPAPKSHVGMIAVSIGLLLVGLVAGYFVGKNEIGNVTYQTATPTASPDWQTYRNEEYGFEFQYPEEAVSVTQSQSGSTVHIGVVADLITIETENVGRESAFDSNSGVPLENIVFAGKKARQYRCPENTLCPNQLSYARAIQLVELPKNWKSNNEIFYDIPKGDDNTLADQILSTFKFTN